MKNSELLLRKLIWEMLDSDDQKAVWYHGSKNDFDFFKIPKKVHTFGDKPSDTPLFFTPDKSFAKMYAGNFGIVYTVKLTWNRIFDAEKLVKSDKFWPPPRENLTDEGKILFDDIQSGFFGKITDENEWEVFHDSEGLFAQILRHDYTIIESSQFKKWLKKRKYDAAYVIGDGPINVFVFNPAQVVILKKENVGLLIHGENVSKGPKFEMTLKELLGKFE